MGASGEISVEALLLGLICYCVRQTSDCSDECFEIPDSV